MKVLKYVFRRSRRKVVLASLAGIVSGACHVILLSLISHAAARGDLVVTSVLAFAGLCVLLPLTRVVSQVWLAQLAQDAIVDLRLRLCQQILGAPLRLLELTGIATLMASLTDDVMEIGNAFTIFPILCTHITVLSACLVYLGFVSWKALLVTLIMLGVGVVGFRLLITRALAALTVARKVQDDLLGHFCALTEGIKELKLHHKRRAGFVATVLQLAAKEYRTHNVVGVGYYASAGGWGQMIQFTLFGLLTFLLPRLGLISYRELVPALLVVLYMASPLDILSSNLPVLGRATVALNAIEKLGFSLEEKSIERSGSRQMDSWESIELHRIKHSYLREGESSVFTVGPIDLTVKPGELIFLVGGNGSGKTTLAKLITGLYTPEAGEVLLDGVAITDETRDDYRQLFSMVFSDFYLFESLIGLDSPHLDVRAKHYLEILQLDSNVKVKNGKLSTIALSQGQRKRLALLTAYLEDRPIYIFDEWAADQDPAFKQVFYHVLLPELKARGKTVIVISHDDGFYQVADRIVKLTYGQLEYDKLNDRTSEEQPVPVIRAASIPRTPQHAGEMA